MRTDRDKQATSPQLLLGAAAFSVMLHITLFGMWYWHAADASVTLDLVVTVRLIPSRPQVASKPAAAAPGATTRDEEKATRTKAAAIVRPLSERATITHVDDTPTQIQAARRAATRPKSHPAESIPRPDVPAMPSLPMDASDNRAQRSREDYAQLLAKRLSDVKSYPALAVSRGEEGTVVVLLDLDRSGHVLASSIVGTSGRMLLDDEVRRMVNIADPFPPFPDSWDRAHAQFEVPITFRLN